ncbi:ABC transporter substrate-binding protein [Pendulispora rubella]|uniref:ABC transporter substrate-binding protein n=1 Tax=Pendulispora rubella TaxID=2741070 RepID=A0ABZ2LLA1_9BACT
MKTTRTFLSVGGLLALATVAPALGLQTTACSKDEPPPASQNPIKIGVSAALDGPYGGTGQGIRAGIRAAAAVINARGGVLGRPIQLLEEDDKSSNPDRDGSRLLKDIINKFRAEKVSAILGPGATVQVGTAMEITYPNGGVKGAKIPSDKTPTLLISAWATSPTLTDQWPAFPDRFLYRTPPSDFYQRQALWKRMEEPTVLGDGGVGPISCEHPFLVYAQDPLGETYNQYGTEVKGLTDAYKSAVKTGQQTEGYAATIDKFKKAPTTPGCVALVTYADVSAQVVRAFRQANITTKFFATDATFDSSFLDIVGDTRTLDMVGVEPDTIPEDYPPFEEFKAIFRAHTPTADGGVLLDPPSYASNAFDAMVLVAFAIQRSGKPDDPYEIRNSLVAVSRGEPAGSGVQVTPRGIDAGFSALASGSEINYQGASGPVDFDENGDVKAGYVKWIFKNGNFQVLSGNGSRYKPTDFSDQ